MIKVLILACSGVSVLAKNLSKNHYFLEEDLILLYQNKDHVLFFFMEKLSREPIYILTFLFKYFYE